MSAVVEQRERALVRANEVRRDRAELKRDIKAGRRLMVDVLADPPEFVASMRIFELLVQIPKWGEVRVRRVLGQLGLSPARPVCELSAGRRADLARRISA